MEILILFLRNRKSLNSPVAQTRSGFSYLDKYITKCYKVLKFIAIISFTIAGLNILGIILEKHFLGIQSLTVLNENISVIVQIFVKEIYRVLYTSTASGTVLGLLFSILCSNGSKNIAK